MKDNISPAILMDSPFGYAYHQIITDKKGKPIDYIFLEINSAFEKLTGLKAKDIKGKKVTEAIPGIVDDEFDWIGFYGNVALNKGTEEFEQYFQPLKRWYKILAHSPEKNYFIAYFIDITSQKLAEQKVHLYAEHLQITLNSIGDAMLATDTKGRITNMNPVAEKLTGWTFEEAKGKQIETVFNIVNALTGNKSKSPINKVLEHGKKVGLANHTKLISKTGNEYQIADSAAPIKDKDGKVDGVVMVFRDVTKEYEARENLLLSEERFRSVTNTISDIVFSCVMNEHGEFRLNWMIGAAEKICGYTTEEILEKKCWKFLILEEDLKTFEKNVTGLKHGEKSNCELRIKHKSGKIIWIQSSAECIDKSKQKILYGALKDVTRRKVTEEENKKLARIFRDSINEVYIFNYSDYKFIKVNDAALKNIGYTMDELQQMTPIDIKPEYDIEQFIKFLEPLRNGEKENLLFETIHRRKDGTTYNVEVHLQLMKYENEKYYSAIILDITKRKIAMQALKESEEKYRTLIENMGEGIILTDLEDRILFVNNRISEIYGYEENELLGKIGYEILESEESIELIKSKNAIRKEKISDTYEVKGIKKSGEIIWTRINGAPVKDKEGNIIGTVGIITDITEEIKTKEALEESQSVFQNVFESANVGKSITLPTGKINVNVAFCEMLGYQKEELEDKRWQDLTPEEDVESIQALLDRVIKGEIESIRFNKRYIHKNGSHIWADVSTKLVRHINGKPKYFITTVVDITEKKKADEELVTAKEKAEESEKLKSAFLANMSHEIRTPMNGILGFLELLKQPELSEENRNKYISIVSKGGKRLLNTINDIIEISKIDAKQLKLNLDEVNINEVMNFHYNFFKAQAEEKGIELKISESISEADSLIQSDKNKIEGILTNLIKNAIKFTNKGTIEFGNRLENDELMFYVKDTGSGIPSDRLEAIFGRFVQADLQSYTRPYEGSGLGLSIVKGYTDLLNGKIRVESELDKGSTFYFTIPYVPLKKEKTVSKLKDLPDNSQLKNLKVLIAEDDETSFMYLENILKKEGMELIHAENGNDAVNLVKEMKDISIVLMDIKMPVLNGLNATKLIRNFNKDIPIIAQTAYAMVEDKFKALEAGCNDYVSKPINKNELITKIYHYIRRKK